MHQNTSTGNELDTPFNNAPSGAIQLPALPSVEMDDHQLRHFALSGVGEEEVEAWARSKIKSDKERTAFRAQVERDLARLATEEAQSAADLPTVVAERNSVRWFLRSKTDTSRSSGYKIATTVLLVIVFFSTVLSEGLTAAKYFQSSSFGADLATWQCLIMTFALALFPTWWMKSWENEQTKIKGRTKVRQILRWVGLVIVPLSLLAFARTFGNALLSINQQMATGSTIDGFRWIIICLVMVLTMFLGAAAWNAVHSHFEGTEGRELDTNPEFAHLDGVTIELRRKLADIVSSRAALKASLELLQSDIEAYVSEAKSRFKAFLAEEAAQVARFKAQSDLETASRKLTAIQTLTKKHIVAASPVEPVGSCSNRNCVPTYAKH